MKGLLKTLLFTFHIFSCFTSYTQQTGTVGPFTYVIEEGGATITRCDTTYSGELIIPEKIEGCPVTSIGDYAMRDCSHLASVEMPDSLIRIGDLAFLDCRSLTDVDIPRSVEFIGPLSFLRCVSLTEIKVDSSNTHFLSLNGLLLSKEDSSLLVYPHGKPNTHFTIPDSVTSIGDSAFRSCDSLISVEIPGSVASIGDSAFRSCDSLISVEIPGSVTSIGNYAFIGCRSLISVELPDSVISIGDQAYAHCLSLISMELPNSVTSIGSSAFNNCRSLTKINIPESVKTIEEFTFSDCISLTDLDIPNSIRSIGSGTFYGCISLTSMLIPNSVTSIGDRAFSSCDELASIVIPDSVKAIGRRAFMNCPSLTSFTVPKRFHSNAEAHLVGDWPLQKFLADGGFHIPEPPKPVGEPSRITIVAPAVELTLDTRQGTNYIIQRSTDLNAWENDGEVFLATNREHKVFRKVGNFAVFFRLVEVE